MVSVGVRGRGVHRERIPQHHTKALVFHCLLRRLMHVVEVLLVDVALDAVHGLTDLLKLVLELVFFFPIHLQALERGGVELKRFVRINLLLH